MKAPAKVLYSFSLVLFVAVLCSSFQKEKPAAVKFAFPYKQAGLTERQAAAHLLSRFTYGAKAEDIDEEKNDKLIFVRLQIAELQDLIL